MNSPVCVDASLTFKLVVDEPDSTLAHALWVEWQLAEVTIIAPTLWAYEMPSALRKRVHRGLLPAELEEDLVEAALGLPVRLLRPAGLHRRASGLARRFNRPASYDAHYLALAEMYTCPLWTGDERLFNAVRQELPWVYWLGNYRMPGVLHEEPTSYRVGS